MSLAGRSALITGSSSGIGEAVALAFAQNGVSHVVVNYPHEAKAANAHSVVARLEALGCIAMAVRADVGVEAEVASMFAEATSFCGHPDIVVNNAGIGHDDAVETLPIETWDAVLNVHLRGTFLVTRAALPTMYKRNWGRIINTVSQLAFKGTPRLSAYVAAKGGVIAFTRSVALEIGTKNFRINALRPERRGCRYWIRSHRMFSRRCAHRSRRDDSLILRTLPRPSSFSLWMGEGIFKGNASAPMAGPFPVITPYPPRGSASKGTGTLYRQSRQILMGADRCCNRKCHVQSF